LEGVSVDVAPLAQQRKIMKALVRTQQPLTAKTKGDEVSEEGTSTLKGSSRLMQLAQQESPLIPPPPIVAKFRNAIGAIIRTKVVVDPTIERWTLQCGNC